MRSLAEEIHNINYIISLVQKYLIAPTENNGNNNVILQDSKNVEISAPKITLNTQECAYIDDKISALEDKIATLTTRIVALESADKTTES